MTRKACLFLIAIFAIFNFENICWAETVKLLAMSGLKKDNMSRISFVFNQIPEFKIEDSGQKVRVIFAQTSFDQSFKKMPLDEVIFQIEAGEKNQESVIDLYLRNVPKFVDVTVDKQNARLNVNIFWDQERLGSRPAILDQRLGEVKISKDGSTAQKIISSQYSGRWIDFFRDFEWPITFSLPINFAFPQFPSPLFMDQLESLSQDLIHQEASIWCDQASKRMTDLGADNTEFQDIDLYALLLAECLLRQKDSRKALDVLKVVVEESSHESVVGWLDYYRAYARAISGKYYQARNFLVGWEEKVMGANPLAEWCRMLQVELNLAKNNPEKVLDMLSKETPIDAHLLWLYKLRKADALYQLGQIDDAYDAYQNVVSDTHLIQQHPQSMANWADVLYRKKQFSEAHGYYLQLHEIIRNEFFEQAAMVNYRVAMSRLRSGDQEQAKLILSEIIKKNAGTEAGVRSWLKLIDIDLLSDSKPALSRVLSDYGEIIGLGPTRDIREEAFFKQILACHLYGENFRAVKLLGHFFEDYWAGVLQPEAQALFVEIFPAVAEELVDQDLSLVALSLVAKHRNLLSQAHITYDFLYNLAKSYCQLGFFDQAETTYLFMLDFEKNKEGQSSILFKLIQIYYQQNKFDQVQKYASDYLKRYPEGTDRDMVLYYYSDVLFRQGNVGEAVAMLIDKNRPKTKELDRLAGDIFFELGQYDLAEQYLARAAEADATESLPGMTLKRAEAAFFTQNWQNAIPLYETLLDKPRYSGQAGYRLIQIFYKLGQQQKALKLYNKLAETEIEKQWLKLAEETILSENSIMIGN